MRKKKSTTLIAAMLVSVLTLSITACKSTPIIETQTIIPAIYFPTFPDPTGFVELDEETETVKMPLDYYARIYEYKTRVDEAEAIYNRIKELYAENKNDYISRGETPEAQRRKSHLSRAGNF